MSTDISQYIQQGNTSDTDISSYISASTSPDTSTDISQHIQPQTSTTTIGGERGTHPYLSNLLTGWGIPQSDEAPQTGPAPLTPEEQKLGQDIKGITLDQLAKEGLPEFQKRVARVGEGYFNRAMNVPSNIFQSLLGGKILDIDQALGQYIKKGYLTAKQAMDIKQGQTSDQWVQGFKDIWSNPAPAQPSNEEGIGPAAERTAYQFMTPLGMLPIFAPFIARGMRGRVPVKPTPTAIDPMIDLNNYAAPKPGTMTPRMQDWARRNPDVVNQVRPYEGESVPPPNIPEATQRAAQELFPPTEPLMGVEPTAIPSETIAQELFPPEQGKTLTPGEATVGDFTPPEAPPEVNWREQLNRAEYTPEEKQQMMVDQILKNWQKNTSTSPAEKPGTPEAINKTVSEEVGNALSQLFKNPKQGGTVLNAETGLDKFLERFGLDKNQKIQDAQFLLNKEGSLPPEARPIFQKWNINSDLSGKHGLEILDNMEKIPEAQRETFYNLLNSEAGGEVPSNLTGGYKRIYDLEQAAREKAFKTGTLSESYRQSGYDPIARMLPTLGKLSAEELDNLVKSGNLPSGEMDAAMQYLADAPEVRMWNNARKMQASKSLGDLSFAKKLNPKSADMAEMDKGFVWATKIAQIERMNANTEFSSDLNKAGLTSSEAKPGMVDINVLGDSAGAKLLERQIRGTDIAIQKEPLIEGQDQTYRIIREPLGDVLTNDMGQRMEGLTNKEAAAFKKTNDANAKRFIDRGAMMEINARFGKESNRFTKGVMDWERAGTAFNKAVYSPFKQMWTTLNPKTHIGNKIYNEYMQAIRLGLKTTDRGWIKDIMSGRDVSDPRAAAFQASGAWTDTFVESELGQGGGGVDVSAFLKHRYIEPTTWQKIKAPVLQVTKWAAKVYQDSELQAKSNIFFHALEEQNYQLRGGQFKSPDGRILKSPKDFSDADFEAFRKAGDDANFYLTDYGKQSRAMKIYRTIPGGAPFPTFYVDQIPKMILDYSMGKNSTGKANFGRAARFWAVPVAMEMLNEYAKKSRGINDKQEAELRDALPQMYRAATGIPELDKYLNPIMQGPMLPKLPWGEQDLPTMMPTGGFLPFGAANQTKGSLAAIPSFVAPLQDPFSQMIMSYQTGREPYGNKDLWDKNAPALVKIPAAFDYATKNYLPPYFPYGSGTRKVLDAIRGVPPSEGEPPENPWSTALGVVSPFRQRAMDEGRSAQYKDKEWQFFQQTQNRRIQQEVEKIDARYGNDPNGYSKAMDRLIKIEQAYTIQFFKNNFPNTYKDYMIGGQ